MNREPVRFFLANYKRLRSHRPMKWMTRMFCEVIRGEYRPLIDLPTGAGKTELVVVWLLALAWHGKNRRTTAAVPRRLVWVVNRRVLVQQVFTIAAQLQERLAVDGVLSDVRTGLAELCGIDDDVFRVVQLRGQIIADREWAIRPTVPQLIIGTVDQIGSRIVFQGYGLGKWSRPQHAGLLAVDVWVAVDEAHLVPAYVLTLRQLAERCASQVVPPPPPFESVYKRLPFWVTELSATPGLPPPSDRAGFSLTEREADDPILADRMLAARSRRVLIEPLPKGKKPHELLAEALVKAAFDSNAGRIAIFVREARVANAVDARLRKQGVQEGRICKITGRIRGYERDRLVEQSAFKAFVSPRTAQEDQSNGEQWFLVGTAAAEVGLDADADLILCDFAPLPTLLQRLGRLDRRGTLSRRHAEGQGDAPTMQIFACREVALEKVQTELHTLSTALKADTSPYSGQLLAATHWHAATKNKDEGNTSGITDRVKALQHQATWDILSPDGGLCQQSSEWLSHDFARIAAGPVVVPPVTDAVLDYWSATTEPCSPHLSPHSFLYGLVDDDESTPLVGVAFRLEVEALRASGDDAEIDAPDPTAEVLEIFKRFPPLRAEFHQVTLSTAREWLGSPEAEEYPLLFRRRDKWLAKLRGESTTNVRAGLGPNGTLILPASIAIRAGCKKLLEESQSVGSQNRTLHDVLEGVSASARYRRTIEPAVHQTGGQGAWIWDFDSRSSEPSTAVSAPGGFDCGLRKQLRIHGMEYVFRYYRPAHANVGLQFLDNHDDVDGHLARAEAVARRIADAVAPDSVFLSSLLAAAARYHDEGKRFKKWQRAFGWRNGMREIAKLRPDLERPAALHGFRHEWESLRRLVALRPEPSEAIPNDQKQLWCDLLQHLVGVHHGHLRPSIADEGLTPDTEATKQNPLRIEAAERFVRLQCQLGRWRLAYLEALLKTADAESSRVLPEDEEDNAS